MFVAARLEEGDQSCISFEVYNLNWRFKYERTFSTVCSLCELDEDDPIGEGGRQEGGDKAPVHCEEPASWDVRPAFQFSYQNLEKDALT